MGRSLNPFPNVARSGQGLAWYRCGQCHPLSPPWLRMILNKIPVPVKGIFRYPFETFEIYLHKAEGRAITASPLEIVKQRPYEIPTNFYPAPPGLDHGGDIISQKIDSSHIMNLAIR